MAPVQQHGSSGKASGRAERRRGRWRAAARRAPEVCPVELSRMPHFCSTDTTSPLCRSLTTTVESHLQMTPRERSELAAKLRMRLPSVTAGSGARARGRPRSSRVRACLLACSTQLFQFEAARNGTGCTRVRACRAAPASFASLPSTASARPTADQPAQPCPPPHLAQCEPGAAWARPRAVPCGRARR